MSEPIEKDAQRMFDLWDNHLAAEFHAKDAQQAIGTMTEHPRVNIVPLMIGGTTHAELLEFYAHRFLSQLPPDIEIIPVSRTGGQSRVVDELVMRFTHSLQLDWLLPGIPPTGKRVELPFVVIVQFDGDQIAHEHLYWDQASLLLQVGVLDASLPIVGAESARQVLNPTQPMNELLRRPPLSLQTSSRPGMMRMADGAAAPASVHAAVARMADGAAAPASVRAGMARMADGAAAPASVRAGMARVTDASSPPPSVRASLMRADVAPTSSRSFPA